MQKMEHDLSKETNLAHKIHQALSMHTTINPPVEGGSFPGKFGQYEFKISDTDSHFNVFIHKNKIYFKVDHFEKNDRAEFEQIFCNAFNIDRTTVDNVLKAYMDVVNKFSTTGILSVLINNFDKLIANPISYISFKSKYAQDDVCVRYSVAQLKFNHAYKKNKRYNPVKLSFINSQLYFYIDQDNNIKPIFIINTWFDQDYEASFIVDVYSDKVYTTRKVFAARSYEDLISMSRPINKEELPDIMESKFISRLLPVIKKRYGLTKNQIDLDNIDMRNRYISLLMMESI